LKVAVIAMDRISPLHLAVPCAVFGDAHPGAPRFDLEVCAVGRRALATTAPFSVHVRQGLAKLADADLVVVPSWPEPSERPPTALLNALVAADARGASVMGLCLGAYVLAYAGLLDGHPATTHWAFARDFAARFPSVAFDPNALYIETGRIWTSAGAAAGFDCCLHFVRRRLGAASANAIARHLVVPPHRAGGQVQFIDTPVPTGGRDAKLLMLLADVERSLDFPHTLTSLACDAGMSRRTLTRRIRALTGSSFIRWLAQARIRRCQHLLETTDQSLETIVHATGFGSVAAMRAHFSQFVGVPPGQWRHTFRIVGGRSKQTAASDRT
jgi:transcriptional regulator GlxA family with amidase domain